MWLIVAIMQSGRYSFSKVSEINGMALFLSGIGQDVGNNKSKAEAGKTASGLH